MQYMIQITIIVSCTILFSFLEKRLLPDLIPYVLFPSIKGDVLFHVLDEVQKTSSSLMDDI